MTIYNYKPKTVIDEIILRFWATTPDNPGESSPVVITSYTDGIFSNIIDQDSQFAKVTVNDVPSPEVFSIALSELYSGLGKQVIATFSFNPTISIPASGYISITFDPRLTVGEITAGSCMIYSIATASYVASPNCFKKNREIVIQLGSEQYTKGSVYSIQLVRMLFSPESSGTFFTDVTMFQPDFATRILSYTQRIAFFPAVFIFPSMSLYPNERFQSAVLDFSFITPFDIPASRPQNISTETVSFISIGFMPSGPTSLQVDLGYSSSFPTFIPCLEIEGLLPVDGNHINCTVKAFDSPSIILQNYHAIKAGTTLRFVVSSFNNPDGNFITKISIVKKFNRILSKIAEHSETFLVSSTVLRRHPHDTSCHIRQDFGRS